MWFVDTDGSTINIGDGASGWHEVLQLEADGGMLRIDGSNAMTGDLDMDNLQIVDPKNDATLSVGLWTKRIKFDIAGTEYAVKAYALS
jgi:hypothetical protein